MGPCPARVIAGVLRSPPAQGHGFLSLPALREGPARIFSSASNGQQKTMTFFDRFDPKSRMKPDDRYLASIVENLNNILNTKKDYGSVLNEIGIRDLNEFRSHEDIIAVVIEEVKENIEKFEPRVKLVEISPEETDRSFVLSFKIECIVRMNTRSLHMVFDTLFSKFHVQNFQD
jgi:type VI secretion system lysozyme-like protein